VEGRPAKRTRGNGVKEKPEGSVRSAREHARKTSIFRYAGDKGEWSGEEKGVSRRERTRSSLHHVGR